MRAAYLVGRGASSGGKRPNRNQGPNQVLCARTLATVCGSDLHNIFAGTNTDPYPCRAGFPGHESVGTVVASTSPLTSPSAMRCCRCPISAAPPRSPICSWCPTISSCLFRRRPPHEHGSGPAARHSHPCDGAVLAGRQQARAGNRDRRRRRRTSVRCLLRRAGFEQIVVSDPHRSRLERAAALGATQAVAAEGDASSRRQWRSAAGVGADLVVEAAGEDETRTPGGGCSAASTDA